MNPHAVARFDLDAWFADAHRLGIYFARFDGKLWQYVPAPNGDVELRNTLGKLDRRYRANRHEIWRVVEQVFDEFPDAVIWKPGSGIATLPRPRGG